MFLPGCSIPSNTEFKLELYHPTQSPMEIIDLIIDYLSFTSLHAIAVVSSALRLPCQLRLFRWEQIVPYTDPTPPHHTRFTLFYLHLLQYGSHLIVTRSFMHRNRQDVRVSFTDGPLSHYVIPWLLYISSRLFVC